MLSRNLEQTLRQALAQANARRHEYATLEHLLLSLTEDQDAVAVMRAFDEPRNIGEDERRAFFLAAHFNDAEIG